MAKRKPKLTPLSKILFVALILAAVYFGLKALQSTSIMETLAPSGKSATTKAGFKGKKDDIIKVCVVTWGGYAGGQYFNEGFKASKDSRFFKDYGILVEFKVMDDFNASRAAWKAGEVDLQWITADAFPTEANNLKEFSPKILFQADWSRGGDAIVVRPGIANVAQLKGKKVAVAFGTPSHTFLLWMLDAGNMTNHDVNVVEVPSAIDAAAMFKSGRVDAAVVWSPDDEDCVSAVNGAKILKSTREASHIIADVFYAKADYIEKNEEKLRGLIEGWFRGAAEINGSENARQKAAQILSQGLGLDEQFCMQAINNVRLCTYGDNLNFFGINTTYRGVTGEALYNRMSELYAQIGLVSGMTPAWRTVTHTNILRSITALAGVEHEGEKAMEFQKATTQQAQAEAFATKQVTINFESGSYALNQTTSYIVDQEVAKTLLAFGNVRVRVEGNTDNIGGLGANVQLSKRRAQSVVDHLVRTYQFSPNRFIVVGNGPNKPVASNDNVDGRSRNRRTDIVLLDTK